MKLACGWFAFAGLVLAACGGETSPEATVPPPVPIEDAADTAVAPPPFWKLRFPAWDEPFEPFRIIGEVYYVGSKGLGMYFIPTPEGHIVIDGGVPETGAQVLANIRTLGFDPDNVKILLNTHAHFDHSGGLAELKVVTGAELIASDGDRSALEGGFYLGSEEIPQLNAPPVEVDRVIEDGEDVQLGGVTLTARLTPGHSRGCTSWVLSVEEDGVRYEVLIFGSATVAANRLSGPPQYAGIVEDYRVTFAKTKDWRPDVFLANHPESFDMLDKRAALRGGDLLAFVDQAGFPEMMARLEAEFEAALAKAGVSD